jgi:hypothetical protein
MRFSTAITTLGAIASVAHAIPSLEERGTYEVSVSYDYGGGDGGGSSYPSQVQPPSSANTQYVTVGGSAGLVYTPEYVYANVGDVVIFDFGTKNHTLTQSSFAEPCQELSGGNLY